MAAEASAEVNPVARALRAAAAEPVPEVPPVVLESSGVLLIYGRDEKAIEAGRLLEPHLDVTVVIKPPVDLASQPVNAFPVALGNIRFAKGHLGAFEVTVDDFAPPSAASPDTLSFRPPSDGAASRCDIILDLSGGTPLFSAPELRDGYLRADPRDPAGTLEAIQKARDLVGVFEKPRYIAFTEHLCAHSRSRITGCTRCLDLCPAGAISPAGDHVSIDPNICAGCGQCASVCPTGAAAYSVPPSDVLMRQLRLLLITYREAGGTYPIVLIHDGSHGAAIVEALGNVAGGFPERVLPLRVNEITQVGLEIIAAAFVFGASAVRLLTRERPRHDISGLTRTLGLAEPILAGLGFGTARVTTIQTDDPDILDAELRAIPRLEPAPHPSSFLPMGGEKRGANRFVLRELHRAAPAPVNVIPLPQQAPFGAVEIDVAGCTLCLACVSACPTSALRDNIDQPMLRFAEDACIQCGLCKATCPEKVITLRPQLDFRPTTAAARILKAEEPFCCIRCGKPFGIKSTIERVLAKLTDQHWMFTGSTRRLDLVKMCDDCRVITVTEQNFDPHAPPRPPMRTTDDYLREREQRKDSPPDDKT